MFKYSRKLKLAQALLADAYERIAELEQLVKPPTYEVERYYGRNGYYCVSDSDSLARWSVCKITTMPVSRAVAENMTRELADKLCKELNSV